MDSGGNVYVADMLVHTVRKITPAGVVTTLAGSHGLSGAADGTGTAANFNSPFGVAVDSIGNVYVADAGNATIRKISPAGIVTTLAGAAGQTGYTDGTGGSARFSYPNALAVDTGGNVYVTDDTVVRVITPAGVVTTLAGLGNNADNVDGIGNAARFSYPRGLTVDSDGNVYVADTGNFTIRKITPAGAVTTLAGNGGISGSLDGTGSAAGFLSPIGVTIDATGNLYAGDGNAIRKITQAGVVTTLAGDALVVGSADGVGGAARFNSIEAVTVNGNSDIFVADLSNNLIRRVTPAGVVTTFAGYAGSPGSTDGTGGNAKFSHPIGLAADTAGNVYVADRANNTIRKMTPAGVVTTLAGTAGVAGSADGTGAAASFNGPYGVAVDSAGNVYVVELGNRVVRKITPAGVVTTLAGSATQGGHVDATGSAARFRSLRGVGVDHLGNVYVSDSTVMRKITPGGVVTTLAGSPVSIGSTDGIGAAARFSRLYGIAVDPTGDLFVADSPNHTIRKITSAGVVTTIAGSAGLVGSTDGTGTAARFNTPFGLALDGDGNLYVSDSFNLTIRKITPAGVVTTLAGMPEYVGFANGTGSAVRFAAPYGVTVDAAGNIYVADVPNNTIRKGVAYAGGPAVSVQSPTRNVLTPGQNLDLSVTALGTGTLSYQWTHNGKVVAGATGSTLSLTNVTFQGSGYYLALVTDDNGTRRSAPMFVTVAPALTRVRGWGFNGLSQLAIPADLYDAVGIVTGGSHTLAIRSNGMVVAWGDPGSGQTTIPAGLTDAVGIAAGDAHSVVLKSDGTVIAWGWNEDGQADVPAGLTDVVAIASGSAFSLALTSDGKVTAWGINDQGQCNVPIGLSGVLAISANGTHALALKSDGTVVTWGANNFDQNAIPVGLADVVSIATGHYHSLALKSDGTVVAWGANYGGQTNVPVGLSNVVGVSAGNMHSLALKADGLIVGWGDDSYNQAVPPADLVHMIAVSACNLTSVALHDGTTDTAPAITTQPVSATRVETETVSFSVGADGGGPFTYQWRRNGVNLSGATSSTLTLTYLTQPKAGNYDVVVTNYVGSTTSSVAVLTVNPILLITDISTTRQVLTPGQSLNLSVTATGTGTLSYQWIRNGRPVGGATSSTYAVSDTAFADSGWYTVLITDNYSTQRSAPMFVTVAPVATEVVGWGSNYYGETTIPDGLTDAIGIAAGSTHSMALKRDGTVAAWGRERNTYLEYAILQTNVVSLVASGTESRAVKSNGSVAAWGIWGFSYPLPDLTDAVAIAATIGGTSLALRSDGTITAWGPSSNSYGGVTNVVAVSAGADHALALKSDGTVVGWGRNDEGQTTIPVGLTDVVAIAAGAYHSMALKADGTVVAWGSNTDGQCNMPVGLTDVIALAGGFTHSLALKADGTVVSWGIYGNGETEVPSGLAGVFAISCSGFSLALRDVNAVPVITTQPGGQTVLAGATVTFTAAANSTPMPTYQWQKNGVDLPGATGTTLTLSNVQVSNAGSYRVIATNVAGSATSNAATLVVNMPPAITTQPIGHYVTVGANATLSVVATGFPAPTYQWRRAGVDIPGANSASYTITNAQLADTAVYTVVATNLVGTATSNATTLTVTTLSLTPKPGDFTNDGNPDILWRNNVTGAFALWLMNGTVRQSAFIIGSAPLDWEVSGTGDFNADGQTDLLWRNPTTGTVAFWLMNGTALQSIVVTANVPTDWTIYGTGDFNNDGKVDILWRNPTSGTVAYWLMNGTAQQSVVVTTNVPTEWTIYGTGDFNNDGKVDILWRKPSTGDVAFWLMNGTTLQSVVVTANVPTNWTIAGTGDYNADGQVDILWQNYSTGGVAFWLMNGTAMQSAVVIGNIPADWLICN